MNNNHSSDITARFLVYMEIFLIRIILRLGNLMKQKRMMQMEQEQEQNLSPKEPQKNAQIQKNCRTEIIVILSREFRTYTELIENLQNFSFINFF